MILTETTSRKHPMKLEAEISPESRVRALERHVETLRKQVEAAEWSADKAWELFSGHRKSLEFRLTRLYELEAAAYEIADATRAVPRTQQTSAFRLAAKRLRKVLDAPYPESATDDEPASDEEAA